MILLSTSISSSNCSLTTRRSSETIYTSRVYQDATSVLSDSTSRRPPEIILRNSIRTQMKPHSPNFRNTVPSTNYLTQVGVAPKCNLSFSRFVIIASSRDHFATFSTFQTAASPAPGRNTTACSRKYFVTFSAFQTAA